ncbi:hypothetical protein CW751_14530 [Brumimicrobium salinarum]|uniref:Thioredoxin-like fold domain-containing protein n=1 Tax=Brumimicrobium salinarum TaxID=2058658 RepID=A0A2I0QZ03_9FLAO|nr:thioredoxin domain-containing protein [Brumimicrobium salinarum]PKR79563.1 hypothetical protein CW751_14530 [Brumimicrobium salinarum]
MKLKLLSIFICFIGFSCKHDLVNENDVVEVIATLNGEKFDKKHFDSITASQVFELKINIIKEEIANKLIEAEAKKKNISSYEFINSFHSSIADSLIQIELKRKNYNQIVNIDSSEAHGIYKTTEYHVKKTILGEKLINSKSFEIFLEKEFHQSFTGEVYGSYLIPPKENVDGEIVVLSNYECSYCYNFHKKIKSLIEENNNNFNFKFVYFGDQILKFANAPVAAGQQSKFNEMNDFVFKKVQDGNISDSLIFEFAKELNLDLKKFRTDYFSADTYKILDENRKTIISNNIYSTPTLIIDNMIYDEPNILDILKRKINERK